MSIKVPDVLVTTNEKQVRRHADDWISFYANHFNVAVGLIDTTINFGRSTDFKENDKPVIHEHIEILITKEMAKLLYVILGQQLSLYEEKVGPIVLPEPKKTDKEATVLASAARRRKKA